MSQIVPQAPENLWRHLESVSDTIPTELATLGPSRGWNFPKFPNSAKFGFGSGLSIPSTTVVFFPHLLVRNPHLCGSESRVSEEISKNPHLRRVIF